MPTPIKYDHRREDDRDKLRNGYKAMLRSIRTTLRDKHTTQYTDLVLTEWDKDELDRVDAMRHFLGPSVINATPVHLTADVTIDHPVLPRPKEVSIGFRIDNPKSSIARPFPKKWLEEDFRLPHGTLNETFHAVAYEALDYHCIKETLRFLSAKCDTYEQALYLFPHFRTVIKKSAVSMKHENIEVKRAPATLPQISECMRRMIKHAHTLMGMHTLLETFTNPRSNQIPGDGETCVVTLSGSNTFDVDNGAGVVWEYRLGLDDD